MKSGRTSPYFFNTGLFDSGAKLAKLGQFYAQALIHSKIDVDILYGPAYKGIPLVSAASIAYAQMQKAIFLLPLIVKKPKIMAKVGI